MNVNASKPEGLKLSRPRTWIGLPFDAVQLVVMITGWLLGWISNLFQRLSMGALHHVYVPIMLGKRIATGAAYWQPHDLGIGRQPKRAVDLAAARADKSLIEIAVCVCDDPACEHRGKTVFMPRAVAECVVHGGHHLTSRQVDQVGENPSPPPSTSGSDPRPPPA